MQFIEQGTETGMSRLQAMNRLCTGTLHSLHVHEGGLKGGPVERLGSFEMDRSKPTVLQKLQ